MWLHFAWSPGLPLKSGWKLPWPHYSCILHACRTSIICMMLNSAISLSGGWAPLNHGFSGIWLAGQLSTGKEILWKQLGATEALSSQRKVSNALCFSYPWACMGKVWLILEMPWRHLSYCPEAKYLPFSNGANLFRNYVFINPIFAVVFLTKLKISSLYALLFKPYCHSKPG
jgi:hypothetical protein